MNLKRLYYRWRLARAEARLQDLREDRWTYQTIADIRGPSHPFHQRVAGLVPPAENASCKHSIRNAMKLESITVVFAETCRCCRLPFRFRTPVSPDSHPELPLGDAIELACHEHLEAEGWTDSLCPFCAGLTFFDRLAI